MDIKMLLQPGMMSYKYGPKSKEARAYMNDPDNYYIETAHANKRDGAKLGETYRDPEQPNTEKAEEEKCP